MPSIVKPDGLLAYVPGVYSAFDVVSSLPGAPPDFHVPLCLAGAEEGYPYNVRDSMQAHENLDQFVYRGTASSAGDEYGADSDMAQGMKWGKRRGLPYAYCVCMSDLVRASVVGTSAGPVTEITIYSQKYGTPGGHLKLRWTGGIMEVTPLRNYSRLTANFGAADTRLYCRDNSWVKVDSTITLGSNGVTNTTKTIVAVGTDLDANGQVLYWVEIDSAVGSALNTADYAIILEYDDNKKETSPGFAAGEGQLLLDWLQNTSAFLNGKKETGTFSGALLIDVATATALKDIAAWSTVTEGESPAPTTTDHDDFIDDLDASEWDRFCEVKQVIPQGFLIVDDSSTIHASWKDWAVTKRSEGYPVSITTGGGWGDVVVGAGDDTDPLKRAADLNSENVMLCAGGLDRLDAYLSFAPSVWGARMGSGIPHNLTNDDLDYSELEVKWDERISGELTALHRGGVCVYRLSYQPSIRFRISQGLSTLQDNSVSWNENTDDTPLVMQRDLADYIDRVMKLDLDQQQVGADEVTRDTIAAVVVRRADRFLLRRGLITGYTINSITLNDSGAGYDLDWAVTLPVTNDFITMTTTILVGEEAA